MIIANIIWTKENIWEFVKYYMLYKTKTQKTVLLSFIACAVFLALMCLIVFILVHDLMILYIFFGALIIICGYSLFFYLFMKNMAKRLLSANIDSNGLELCFDDKVIFIRKNNIPYGMINWEDVSEIHAVKNAAYITSKENFLILVEYSNISIGNKDDFIKLLESKNGNIKIKS